MSEALRPFGPPTNGLLPRPLPRGECRWLVAAALLATLSTSSALALDPNRPLTQAGQRIWQTQQGLAQPTITCIRQRHDGYLWLGTRTGVVRFDGMRFIEIRVSDAGRLENAWIHDLREDAAQNLWVATDGAGLIRLAGGQATYFGEADGLPSQNVRCLLVDQQGHLWAGTERGLTRLNADKFEVFGQEQGWPHFDVHAICQDAAGKIWVGGSHSQLSVGGSEGFVSRAVESMPANATVHALLSSRAGAQWIGTSDGLLKLEHGQEQLITADDGLGGDLVLCLAEGRHGSVWVGTKDGFSRVHGAAIESFRTEQGLSQSMVYTICEDHEGSLWVGTKYGLNQFIDRRTVPFTTNEGLPSNNTGPIVQDRAGTIWVGTLDAGLARYNGRSFSALSPDAGVGRSIYALADGNDEDLWVGTNEHLCRLRDGQVVESFAAEQGLPEGIVRCICPDQRGTLWIGTAAGLAALRGGRFEKIQPDGDLAGRAVIAMIDCGTFLLASIEGRGVFRCENDKLAPFYAAEDAAEEVDAFCRDAEGLLWMATRGAGLRLVDGDQTYRFTSRDGLYDDEIFGIVADDQDRLWLACSKGCFTVSRSNLRKFATGEMTSVETTWFSPLDALHTLECQEGVQPVVSKTQDGRVWFSTIRGLFVIHPSQLLRQLPPTTVVVEEVIVNGQNEKVQSAQTIGPGQANVSFRYTALSYASPQRITFRYRLDGFDKDWIDAGTRREAFYTNLPPGEYRFRVVARNADEKEYEAASPLALTVTPYFYQTTWFWLLSGTLVALAGWLIYRLRVRRIRERLNAILAERGRIARELHDTLMQGFSGVTMEMQALASRLPPSSDQATLNEIIHDAGSCLREARRSVAGLRGDESGFAASLAHAARQITETSDIRLDLHLDEVASRFPTDVEYNLLRIAQEGISNAVKHSGARNIEVTLDQAPRELRLFIRDDGAGFETNGASQAGLRHYGLIGMRERAAHIGAKLQLQSEPGRGTSVSVVLPMVPTGVPSTT